MGRAARRPPGPGFVKEPRGRVFEEESFEEESFEEESFEEESAARGAGDGRAN